MVDSRAQRGGLLVSALGSAVLAVSMFLPWYSVSFTAAGAVQAQQQFASLAQQYGNANMQAMADQVGAGLSSVVGRSIVTLSAHEALKDLSVILLLLAGVSLLASLLRLADVVEVGGDQIALVGFAAALLVLFRVLSPPGVHTDLVALSPSWGSWVALGAAVAIAGGGVWTPSVGQSDRSGITAEHWPI
jgi:hypothetical protein